jgi:hypothetical protein
MEQQRLTLGRFDFERQGQRLILRAPDQSVATDLGGFLRGVAHLVKMDFDLEGSAELDGGLVFRVAGKQVQLKLGPYAELFPSDSVAALFEQMTQQWAAEP